MTVSQIECLVLLKPTAPFHLGEEGDLGDSADRIHSDTLWAALYSVAVDLGKQQFIDTMMSPDFLISSSFPVWGKISLWPRPYVRMETVGEPSDRKKWRKVVYVSDKLFNRLLKKSEIDFDETVLLPEGCLFLKEELKDKPDCDWLIGVGTTTGNIVDRLTSMADLFDRTDLYVNTAASVRLGVRIRMPEAGRNDLEKCLVELGNRGVGGERSSGKGSFEVMDISDTPASSQSSSGRFIISLSLYHPSWDDVSTGILEKASYDLVVRGGWIDRKGVQKNRLRMLREGSVLPVVNGRSMGDIVDVRPQGYSHAVYRYGRAYPFSVEDLS